MRRRRLNGERLETEGKGEAKERMGKEREVDPWGATLWREI